MRAVWWDEENGQRIGPIFPGTPEGRRLHRLYIQCLAMLHRNQPPPSQAVYDAVRDLGQSDADAADMIEAAFRARRERIEGDKRHRRQVEEATGLPYEAALTMMRRDKDDTMNLSTLHVAAIRHHRALATLEAARELGDFHVGLTAEIRLKDYHAHLVALLAERGDTTDEIAAFLAKNAHASPTLAHIYVQSAAE